MNCLTAAHKSLVLVLELMRLRWVWLRLTMSLPILKARALAFSVWASSHQPILLAQLCLNMQSNIVGVPRCNCDGMLRIKVIKESYSSVIKYIKFGLYIKGSSDINLWKNKNWNIVQKLSMLRRWNWSKSLGSSGFSSKLSFDSIRNDSFVIRPDDWSDDSDRAVKRAWHTQRCGRERSGLGLADARSVAVQFSPQRHRLPTG